jgi:hypothetical protein
MGMSKNHSTRGARPNDIQLIAEALEKAKPWGLEAEFAWSLATHFKTYPSDPMDMAVQVALDDWDLDD